MKTGNLATAFIALLLFSLCSCTKNDTRFYSDGEEDGLSIFSNTGNNVMTCYINSEPWRTFQRTTTNTFILGATTTYEIRVHSSVSRNTPGYVQLFWYGSYRGSNSQYQYIILNLLVQPTSLTRFLNSLQGQRMRIDTATGSYFSTTIGQQGFRDRKANGTIYFETAHVDSTGTNTYRGNISGIFEADFGTDKITKGRFDHALTPEQFQ